MRELLCRLTGPCSKGRRKEHSETSARRVLGWRDEVYGHGMKGRRFIRLLIVTSHMVLKKLLPKRASYE